MNVILDDVACENPEDFRIRLISLNPVISTVCGTEAIVTIRDSTGKTVQHITTPYNLHAIMYNVVLFTIQSKPPTMVICLKFSF